MKILLKSKFVLLLIAGIVSVATIAGLSYSYKARKGSVKPDICHFVSAVPLGFELSPISNAIEKAYRAGVIKPEDFEKLDFSLPGDPSYGDNPDYEVFNPDGKIRARRAFDQEAIDKVTTVKDSKLFFNLRRTITDGGYIRDVLFAVVPNINLEECRENPDFGVTTRQLTAPIGFPLDNSSVAIDHIPLQNTCILMQDHTTYFFMPLADRAKKNENGSWLTLSELSGSARNKSQLSPE